MGYMTFEELAAFSQSKAVTPHRKSVTSQTDWLRKPIAAGFQMLVSLRLKNAPAHDTLPLVKEVWIKAFITARNGFWDVSDVPSIEQAFLAAAAQCEEWPAPKTVLAFLPIKQQQAADDNPKFSTMPDNVKAEFNRIRQEKETEKQQRKKEAEESKASAMQRFNEYQEQNEAQIFENAKENLQMFFRSQKSDFKTVLKRLLTPEQLKQLDLN